MKLFFIFSLILSVLYVQVINCLVLHDIEVPELVKIEGDDDDDMEPIKLDCNYELEEDPSYLVVKWFKDNNNIYQWIRGKPPSALRHFRHHIGEIETTSSDKNHEYRGLTLINPSIELSGTYKCLVQTDRDSKAMEKELHVVDISNSTFVFDNHPVQNETYLECKVTNIFPRPRIHLVSPDESIVLSSNETRIEKLNNNYYDASMTAIAQNTDDDADDFYCFITFDGINLNLTASTVRSSVGRNSLHYSYLWLIFLLAFSTKLFNLF
ncbi:hypothetical protein FF38_10060 [Lucilia cuprina]|uniref:Ig-like domain-containing protein n=1 Tax=Lucilia cuprina TaxID=7375 RepID=A0A0L0CQQ7_LUCCU|nr:hypothetical protein FF38_10060 [Lucilia cuprina]